MSYFNQETQGYVDRALSTLQLWFGSNTGATQPPVTPTPYPRQQQATPPKKDKTLTYVGIGAGVVVLGLVTFVVIKKRK